MQEAMAAFQSASKRLAAVKTNPTDDSAAARDKALKGDVVSGRSFWLARPSAEGPVTS